MFKDSQLLEGAVVIEGKGVRESEDGWGNHLYRPYKAAEKKQNQTHSLFPVGKPRPGGNGRMDTAAVAEQASWKACAEEGADLTVNLGRPFSPPEPD